MQADDAAFVPRLGTLGGGLKLHHLALTGIGHEAQGIAAVQLALVGQARLCLLDAFARVVEQGIGGGCLWIFCPVGRGDTTGVIRINVHMIGHQREVAVFIGFDVDAGIEQVFVGGALCAVAIGQKAAGAEHIANAVGFTLGFEAQALLAIAAQRESAFHLWLAFALLGVGVDDAARGIAIQGRVRPAQHFHALQRAYVDVVGLALSVRHGGRDAIHINLDAAHAKGGACTKAANRQLQVLRVILAVLQLQAGHAAQRFRNVDLPLAVAHALAVNQADGRRCLLQRAGLQGAADGDFGELGGCWLLRLSLGKWGGGQQAGCDDWPAGQTTEA